MNNAGSLNLLNESIKSFLEDSVFNNFYFFVIHSFIGSFFVFIIMFYVVINLYSQKVSFTKRFAASLTGCFLYLSPIFLSYRYIETEIFSVNIAYCLSIYPPYFIFILYFISVYILKANRYRILYIINHCYYILTGIFALFCFIFCLSIYFLTDDRQYRLSIYMFATTLTSILSLIICLIAVKYIKKCRLWLEGYIQRLDKYLVRSLLLSFLRATFFFLLVVSLLSCLTQSVKISNIVSICLIFLVLIIVINIAICYQNKFNVYKNNLNNKNHYISYLIDSISNFTAVKHDFSNIMQVYDGYITVEDYKSLKKYHRSVYKLLSQSSEFLDITKKMQDNPALYSVLLYKLEKASKEDVLLRISGTADTSRINIHPLDLSRIIGILLDNAIEEAVQTEKRSVYFFIEQKSDNSILISISNATHQDININDLFKENYTTKQNHNGIGLSQLLDFVASTECCHLDVEYLNRTITFYLELKCFSKDKDAPDMQTSYFELLTKKTAEKYNHFLF